LEKPRIYIESSGCRRRKLEIAKFYKYFKLYGYKMTNQAGRADYIFLPTCAFKEEEEEYSLSRVKILNRHKGRMLVYGCLPDIAPSKYKACDHIEHLSPKHINDIDKYFPNIKIFFKDIEDPN